MRRTKVKFLVRLLLGLLLISVLFSIAGGRQVFALVAGTKVSALLLAFLLFFLTYVVSTQRWHLFLAAQSIRLPFGRLLSIYWFGSFASNFLPSNIGGDLARWAILRRIGDTTRIAASIMMERLTGVAVLFALASTFPLLMPRLPSWAMILCVIAGAGFLAITVLLMAGPPNRFRKWLRVQSSRRRTMSLLHDLVEAVLLYRGRTAILLWTLVLSILFYALVIGIYWLVLDALGLQAPFVQVAAVVPLILLVSMLPLTPGALGTSEGITVLLYGQIGISSGEGLAAALLLRFLQIVGSSLGGLLWIATSRQDSETTGPDNGEGISDGGIRTDDPTS